ncbi:FmdB family zinc ribbon protein [uncultured Phycicoccus sp.]|uniref:FmdB family zinc ribbon protein n=1 Tax=uncultured Phycicoccus sp. TaxID=661422 RepID=UPI00262CFE4C|nr:FmdB family zinc ribbon protein [uncultured Phycicoccus sp.]
MPTYAYACTECDHRFEVVQSFSDDTLTTCPECAGRLRKLFNAVGIVFKGGGFYRTDSRAGAGSGSSGSGASSASTSGGSGSTGGSSAGSNGSSGSSSGTAAASSTGSSSGGSSSTASS